MRDIFFQGTLQNFGIRRVSIPRFSISLRFIDFIGRVASKPHLSPFAFLIMQMLNCAIFASPKYYLR